MRREYAERMAHLISRGNAKKPDMQARCPPQARLKTWALRKPLSALRVQVVAAIRKDRGIPVVYGHVKGVRIGARFAGRGELAACGLHLQICRGIDARARAPASCIVIAGGYGDDKDKDDEVEYTGEGGRCETSKKQIRDQVLTGGNASLALNHATGCPVRVVRGALQPDGGRVYIYDGLYRVDSCEKRLAEGSTCRVWIFHLRSLARHSRAAETRVAFRALQGMSVLFRNAAAAAPRAARQAERAANPPRSQQAEAARLNVLRRRPGLLAEDISGGAEAVAIPVFCEIPPDDAAAAPITAESALPPGFRYIRHCAAGVSALAAAVAAADAPVVAGAGVGSDRVVPAAEAYVDGPHLQATEGGGILEESADEAAGGIVSAGIALPLEIFRCAQPGKGWGVRCAVPILEGEFIAEYAGEARTAAELEAHHDHEGSDSDEHHAVPALSESYVFELNHFNRDAAADAMLCVDAYSAGNVARFINAAPGGDANVVVQHVFTRAGGADRRAFHRTALFAQCYIEPFTELCYDCASSPDCSTA